MTATSKKKKTTSVGVKCPTGDKQEYSLILTCERNYEWYVSEQTDDHEFAIQAGCHTFDTWEEAFEHYRPSSWYSNSSWVVINGDDFSDDELEKIRLRCIQRLKFMKQEWEK